MGQVKHSYPAGGWLPEGAHLELKWDDQGRDLATNWQGPVQAPGAGEVIAVLGDRPFPNGFGPSYPVVRIDTGTFHGHEFYLGHTTTKVAIGDKFAFGHVLAVADQGHNWAGTTGGWVELGEAFNGLPGPKTGRKWFDPLLEAPLVVTVTDPPMRFGDKGWRIIGLTANLHACGYFRQRFRWTFDQEVHGAVVAFKTRHNIPMPPVAKPLKPLKPQDDRGVVDLRTEVQIKVAADACRRHHKPEV